MTRATIRRRIITRASVLLLLGAVVNVAVAWGCGLWSPIERVVGFRAPDAGDELWWQSHRPAAAAAHPLALWADSGIGCEYRMSVGDREGLARLSTTNGSATLRFPGDSLKDCKITVRSGLPIRSLEGDCWGLGIAAPGVPWIRGPITPTWKPDAHVASVSLDRSVLFGGGSFRMLGERILWPGFAINTLFYAAILWSVFAVPAALRRKRRIKRGLCPKCAYPIGTSDVCTECGQALSKLPPRVSHEEP